jgi:hypothetical protein
MQTKKEKPTPAAASAPIARKPYHPPLLVEHGSLRELTKTSSSFEVPYPDSGSSYPNIYSSAAY